MPPKVSRTSQNNAISWEPNLQYYTVWCISDSSWNTMLLKTSHVIEYKNHGWQWEICTGCPVCYLKEEHEAEFVLSTWTDRTKPSLQSSSNSLCLGTNNTLRFSREISFQFWIEKQNGLVEFLFQKGLCLRKCLWWCLIWLHTVQRQLVFYQMVKKKSMHASALMSQMTSLLSVRAEEAEAQAPATAITTCAGIVDCGISLWSL